MADDKSTDTTHIKRSFKWSRWPKKVGQIDTRYIDVQLFTNQTNRDTRYIDVQLFTNQICRSFLKKKYHFSFNMKNREKCQNSVFLQGAQLFLSFLAPQFFKQKFKDSGFEDMTMNYITINESFLYVFVYSYRVLNCFYPFWRLNYRYWSVMSFTQNILCSLLDCYKYCNILSVSRGPQ